MGDKEILDELHESHAKRICDWRWGNLDWLRITHVLPPLHRMQDAARMQIMKREHVRTATFLHLSVGFEPDFVNTDSKFMESSIERNSKFHKVESRTGFRLLFCWSHFLSAQVPLYQIYKEKGLHWRNRDTSIPILGKLTTSLDWCGSFPRSRYAWIPPRFMIIDLCRIFNIESYQK